MLDLVTNLFREKTHPSLKDVVCNFPFWRFEIMPHGEIFQCCPNWLPTHLGDITKTSLLEAFHSPLAKEIRKSILQGEYKYCDKKLCPYLSQYLALGNVRSPLHKKSEFTENQFDFTESKRVLVMLNYDPSCNLRCPSCRKETVLHKEENLPPRLQEIHEAVMRNIKELQTAGFSLELNITGSGDAFASPLYSRMLREFEYDSKLSLELQTNGVLMEEKKFTDAMYRMTHFIAVSVDAATQESYDKIRVGGSFERLKKNLDWLDSALRGGRFSKPVYYKVNFIVQNGNFREIVPFAKWMLGYSSVTEVWFNLIAHWGHLSENEFSAKAVWQKKHPDHEEFLAAVKDPVLKNPRINLGSLSPYVQ